MKVLALVREVERSDDWDVVGDYNCAATLDVGTRTFTDTTKKANAMSTKSANAPDRPSPKTLITFFLGVILAWPVSPPCAGFLTNATSPGPTDSLGYNLPPDNILSVMCSPSPPVALVSPTQDTILLVSWQDYPAISRVATPFLRLAGVRVEPKNHSKHDTRGGYGITPCATGFELVRVADGKRRPSRFPPACAPGIPYGPPMANDLPLSTLLPSPSSSGLAMPVPAVRNRCPEPT